MSTIFIDVEAAGVFSFPTEVGFATVHPDLSISTAAKLIRNDDWLDDLWAWDYRAETLTGITRAHLMEFGRPVEEVCAWLNERLAHATCLSDAPAYDWHWIEELFAAAGMRPTFALKDVGVAFAGNDIDELMFDAGLKKLKARRPHRADEDARQWSELYVACRRVSR